MQAQPSNYSETEQAAPRRRTGTRALHASPAWDPMDPGELVDELYRTLSTMDYEEGDTVELNIMDRYGEYRVTCSGRFRSLDRLIRTVMERYDGLGPIIYAYRTVRGLVVEVMEEADWFDSPHHPSTLLREWYSSQGMGSDTKNTSR